MECFLKRWANTSSYSFEAKSMDIEVANMMDIEVFNNFQVNLPTSFTSWGSYRDRSLLYNLYEYYYLDLYLNFVWTDFSHYYITYD